MKLNFNKEIIYNYIKQRMEVELKRRAPMHDGELQDSINGKIENGSLNFHMIYYWWYVENGCFFGNSHRYKILTNHGYKSLKNIKIGDKVLTHKNRLKKVIEKPIYNIGYKIPRYTIESETGNKVTVTEEHPFYCKRNGKFEWIKAKNLNENDIIQEVI